RTSSVARTAGRSVTGERSSSRLRQAEARPRRPARARQEGPPGDGADEASARLLPDGGEQHHPCRVPERGPTAVTGPATRSMVDRDNSVREDDLRAAMERTTEYHRAMARTATVTAMATRAAITS